MPVDLAQPRVIAFFVGGRQFTLTVQPISKKSWLKYFAGIVSMQETGADGATSSSYDSSGARLELLEANLVDATGYTPDGSDIKSIAGWQGKLPMAHRRAAADLLVAVERVEGDEEGADAFPVLGQEIVGLKATWTANALGEMVAQQPLIHNFSSPTADHQKRYSRAMSRSIVVGGSRTGQTRWLGAQDVLIDIYDELIQSVIGYCMNGKEFVGPTDICEGMDSYHKVAAATALFAPLEIE